MNYQFQFDAVFAAWPLLLKGTWITVQLSLTATLLVLVVAGIYLVLALSLAAERMERLLLCFLVSFPHTSGDTP